ncbi:hydroxyacylglutathione hydrolase [soil metagenome]
MITITPISALKDNYIWLISNANNNSVVIVDPGEAAPVIQILTQQQLNLAAILLTHHHWDHTAGVTELLQHYSVPVYASSNTEATTATVKVAEGESIVINELGISFQTFAIPAHTRDHVAYFTGTAVFCGDTLFTGGCGRLFEGSAEQMFHSLQKLAALPLDTRIYCGHEYTSDNLRFAECVEPANPLLQQRIKDTQDLRQKGQPTVPTTLALELQTNPFLRCHIPAVIAAAEHHANLSLSNAVEVFATLRLWKDGFK